MEIHPNKMNEDSEVNSNKKKEVMRKIKKEKTKNNDFYHATKYTGRGMNGSLKILYEKDAHRITINTHAKRKGIKKK